MINPKLAALLSTPLLIAVFSLTATQAQSESFWLKETPAQTPQQTAEEIAEENAVHLAKCELLQAEVAFVTNDLLAKKAHLAVPENAENADVKRMVTATEAGIAELQARIAANKCP